MVKTCLFFNLHRDAEAKCAVPAVVHRGCQGKMLDRGCEEE